MGSPEAERHVGFSQGNIYREDSDSDDDSNSVEVTFEPGNPYRRKSSLVSSEIKPQIPQRTRSNKRSECLVHQFLDSQRRADEAVEKDTDFKAHPVYANPKSHINGIDGKLHQCMEQQVEPKANNGNYGSPSRNGTGNNSPSCRYVVDPESVKDCKGQEDQQAWTKEITKSMSELDLAHQQPQEEFHSRTLTKKQLSDMAWGVRELSRRLSSMRIRFRVKTIFILTKIYDRDLVPKTRELVKWLLAKDRHVRYTIYVQDKLKTNKRFDAGGLVDEVAKQYVEGGLLKEEEATDAIQQRVRFWDEDMCKTRPHIFDFIITLGGDGTVLYASWLFQRIVPPVLSFALGSLGFLTKFDFEEYQQTLSHAIQHGVTVSLRLRFEGTIMRSQRRRIRNGSVQEVSSSKSSSEQEDDHEEGEEEEEESEEDAAHRKRDLVEELIGEEKEDARTHRPDHTYEILNEIVVDRGPNPTMSYTELFGDDEHFTSVLADGICVSTPTGSTAYNLAAGGSLCHPENPVMLVTAICPHTLSFRPIVLPDTIVLRVGVPYDARTSSWASFDGRERVELRPGDYVTISASRYPFASVQAEGRRSEDWVNSISGKLGWNTRQKQKGYKEWDK